MHTRQALYLEIQLESPSLQLPKLSTTSASLFPLEHISDVFFCKKRIVRYSNIFRGTTMAYFL